jgi:hypothetical protein
MEFESDHPMLVFTSVATFVDAIAGINSAVLGFKNNNPM